MWQAAEYFDVAMRARKYAAWSPSIWVCMARHLATPEGQAPGTSMLPSTYVAPVWRTAPVMATCLACEDPEAGDADATLVGVGAGSAGEARDEEAEAAVGVMVELPCEAAGLHAASPIAASTMAIFAIAPVNAVAKELVLYLADVDDPDGNEVEVISPGG